MKILTWLRIAWDAFTDALVDTGLFIDELVFGGAGEETRRAEGTQHAQTPGEVSGGQSPDPSPSPGDLRDEIHDSELLTRAADIVCAYTCVKSLTVMETTDLLNLADLLRDRAAQFAALESLDQQ